MKGFYNYWFEILVFFLLFVVIQYGVFLGFFIPAFLGRYIFILMCIGWIINAIDIAFQQLDIYFAQIGINTEEDFMEQIAQYVWAYASSISDRIVEDK